MGGPVSVVFQTFLCIKQKGIAVVVSTKPIFDKSYVDDTYIHRKKNVNDELFQKMNNYHLNIKLTLEENRRQFLDTKSIRKNNTISTQAFTKLAKFPVH